ncbi:MAG: hypothetical protein OXG61_10660 [Chloroflexi bacterium]|nr:hypothetical protein [Chloroflexota bacterium]
MELPRFSAMLVEESASVAEGCLRVNVAVTAAVVASPSPVPNVKAQVVDALPQLDVKPVAAATVQLVKS